MMSQHTAHALRKILPDVEIYDYGVDFNSLWQMTIGVDHIIVVFADTPVDPGVAPVDSKPLVSPFVWALCAKTAKKLKSVTILDLSARQDGGQGFRQELERLKDDALSWLQIVPASDALVADSDGLRRLLRGKHAGGPETDTEASTRTMLLDLLRLRLTDPAKPDDRHAIANVVGPLLLLGRRPTSVRQPGVGEAKADHLAALQCALRTCGLLKDPSEVESDAREQVPTSLPSRTRLFLLDDQWHQGWGEWVCSQIEGTAFDPPTTAEAGWTRISSSDSTVEVFASADPTHLIGQENAPGPFGLEQGQRDKRFSLSLTSDATAGDVLLLDLRLFAGDGARERSWTERLVGACRHFVGAGHAWPGFDAKELDEIENWCRSSDSSDEQTAVRARSLLGRLIALTDLSLPIVLFSSTTDSDLVERFKEYGNVISDFHKPRTFGSSAHEDRRHFADLFRVALKQASVLLDARGFVTQVQAWAAKGRERAWELAGVEEGSEVPWRYAELYADESGVGGGAINRAGGYVVFYRDDINGPTALAKEFTAPWGFSREQVLRRGDFRRSAEPDGADPSRKRMLPFSTPGGDVTKKANRLSGPQDQRKLEFGRRAKAVADAVEKHGRLSACVVDGSARVPGTVEGPDPVYRLLIGALVEFYLYDMLSAIESSWLLPHRTLKAGVFLGAKQWHTKNVDELIRHHWDFGMPLEEAPSAKNAERCSVDGPRLDVGYTEWGPLQKTTRGAGRKSGLVGRSLGLQDAYGLTVAISRERRSGDRVTRAVAVGLRDYRNEGWNTLPWPSELPRQIHYASDDLLHEPTAAASALGAGFHCTLSVGLTSLLHASRAFDCPSSLSVGLRHFRDAAAGLDHLGDLPLWVSVRCVPLLASMQGADFIQFAAGQLPASALLRQAARSPKATTPRSERVYKPLSDSEAARQDQRAPGSPPVKPSQPSTHQTRLTLTPDTVESVLRRHLSEVFGDLAVVAIFSRPEWCVVAVKSRASALPIVPKVDGNLRTEITKGLGCNWKIIAWTDDVAELANGILGQNDGSAKLREDGFIQVASKVSDIKVQAIGTLTGKKVVRATP